MLKERGAAVKKSYLPDSNQQSKTSSTRFKGPLPILEGIVI